MEGGLEILKQKCLDRIFELKDKLMQRFRAGGNIEKFVEDDDLFKNLLPSTTLKAIHLFHCGNQTLQNYILEDYFEGFGHSIVICRNFILLVGGSSHFGQALDSVCVVSFVCDENGVLKISGVDKGRFRLRVKRKFCSCFVYKGKLFVFGGKNKEACDSFEVIDLENAERENRLCKITMRKGYINAVLFEGCAYVVSSETHFIEAIDLNTFKSARCFDHLLYTGYSFIFVTENYYYLISSSGKIVTIDKSWKVYNNEDLKFELTWVQTHILSDGKVYLQDFFSGGCKLINLLK